MGHTVELLPEFTAGVGGMQGILINQRDGNDDRGRRSETRRLRDRVVRKTQGKGTRQKAEGKAQGRRQKAETIDASF